MELWQRLLVIGIVLAVTAVVARLIDRRIMKADRSAGSMTRYRVLRRTIAAAIVTFGLLSALLVIPQVRAVAGGLLASSAVLGLIIGFASQRTLGNFVAGLDDRVHAAPSARGLGRGRRCGGRGRGNTG